MWLIMTSAWRHISNFVTDKPKIDNFQPVLVRNSVSVIELKFGTGINLNFDISSSWSDKITFYLILADFKEARSENVVAMATRRGLSFSFWLQDIPLYI